MNCLEILKKGSENIITIETMKNCLKTSIFKFYLLLK